MTDHPGAMAIVLSPGTDRVPQVLRCWLWRNPKDVTYAVLLVALLGHISPAR